MAKYIYLNNQLVPEKEAKISIFDRSYLYGEGVFETLRAYNGHVAFSDLHYERMKKNCKRLNIDMPVDKHSFEKILLKTINANNIKDAYVRVTVSPVGASFGLKKPQRMTTNFSVFCKEFTGRPDDLYNFGAKVIVVKSAPSDHPTMADIKSTSYLNKMIARDEVVKLNADEGIFCSPEGKVLEGSSTNIFMVRGEKITTPLIKEGVLSGITRNVILNLAEANGIEISEAQIDLKDLKRCDEIFLTGSTTEVLPVKELVDVTEKNPAPGPITKRIMAAYKALLP